MPRFRLFAAVAAIFVMTAPALGGPRDSPASAPSGPDGRWVQVDGSKNAARRASPGRLYASRKNGGRRAVRVGRAHWPPPAPWEAIVSRETSGGLLPAGSYRRHYRGANARLVASINAKLSRWVHPTGKCAGGHEWLATQYGSESGRRTASGAAFIPSHRTAAHNTLPFGTRLNVWMPGSGRSVEVLITDRGPATHADIDLSTGAAGQIGMRSSAYICVRML